jgi:ABC-type nitrate/sulfonate/bicarbonate transport system substrate-binding protein
MKTEAAANSTKQRAAIKEAFMSRGIKFLNRLCLSAALCASAAQTSFAAERLVGLQSAPSIAMALPWVADETRLYSKYDLDFQLVYIASSGIVTAAMSSGNGNVAIVGGEGPIRAYLAGNTDFVFIARLKTFLLIASWAIQKSNGPKI